MMHGQKNVKKEQVTVGQKSVTKKYGMNKL